eukprot:Gb_38125 [translate_table: standard]
MRGCCHGRCNPCPSWKHCLEWIMMRKQGRPWKEQEVQGTTSGSKKEIESSSKFKEDWQGSRLLGVFEECLVLLQMELVPDPSFGRAKYRSILMNTFFYKSLLSIWPANSVPPQLRSAIMQDIRPISSGSISFDKGDPSEYPVSQALPKLSAPAQVLVHSLKTSLSSCSLTVNVDFDIFYVSLSTASMRLNWRSVTEQDFKGADQWTNQPQV